MRVRGFGLMELLIVVSLVSLATVGVLMLQSRATSGVDSVNTASDVMAMAAGMRQITGGRPSYEGLTHEHLIKAEKHPPHLQLGSEYELMARWGSKITVGEVKVDGVSHFGIRYAGMPPSECVSVVQALRDSFDMIRVRGTDVVSGEYSTTTAIAGRCAVGAIEAGDPIIIDPTLPEPPDPGSSILSGPVTSSGFGLMDQAGGLAPVEFVGR